LISVRSEVQIFPGPPIPSYRSSKLLIPGGAIAQLGERLLCKQEVVGSIPSGSTSRDFVSGLRFDVLETPHRNPTISSAEKNQFRVRQNSRQALTGRRAFCARVIHDIVKRKDRSERDRDASCGRCAILRASNAARPQGPEGRKARHCARASCRLLDRTPSERSEASWSF
jgi:hypothetical protein